MKLFVFLSLLLLGGTWYEAYAQEECPAERFDVVWSVLMDRIVPASTTFNNDPSYSFFSDVLNYDAEQLNSTIQDAFDYYNERFGLDYSQASQDSQSRRFFQNSFFEPFRVGPALRLTATVNRWLINGVLGSNTCVQMLEGGFTVRFIGNQTVFGTYGGTEGRTLHPTDDIGYAFFRLNICNHNPLILQCQAVTPTFLDPVGLGIRNWECFNQFLGRGLILGAQGPLSTGDPNTRRVVVRHTITFPAHP